MRPYPARLPVLEYPGHYQIKRVPRAGTIRFKHKLLFLVNALKEHHVGLEESEDGIRSRYLDMVLLGKIDRRPRRLLADSHHQQRYPSSRNTLLPIIPLAQRQLLGAPPAR